MKKAKITGLVMMLLTAVLLLTACGSGGTDSGNVKKLSFKAASGYEELKAYNNQKVAINGYLATSSPADGSFIFLMNMPYQSCPFCVPNTSQLSNTLEVYPKSGQRFSYTSQAVQVTGTLEVAPAVDEFFTDPYGYEFNFRITDAEYTILKDSEMSEDFAVWQKIAGSGIINAIYDMYDYLDFTVNWPNYYSNSWEDMDGVLHAGQYMEADIAVSLLTEQDSGWSYGYRRDYFTGIEDILNSLKAEKAVKGLLENVRKVEKLARRAEQELLNGSYTCQKQYVEMFGEENDIYTLNNGRAMQEEADELYYEFAEWLASWEV